MTATVTNIFVVFTEKNITFSHLDFTFLFDFRSIVLIQCVKMKKITVQSHMVVLKTMTPNKAR